MSGARRQTVEGVRECAHEQKEADGYQTDKQRPDEIVVAQVVYACESHALTGHEQKGYEMGPEVEYLVVVQLNKRAQTASYRAIRLTVASCDERLAEFIGNLRDVQTAVHRFRTLRHLNIYSIYIYIYINGVLNFYLGIRPFASVISCIDER